MVRLLGLTSLFGLLVSCSKDPQLIPPKLEKPIVMSAHCQSTPQDTFYRIEYQYALEKLVAETMRSDEHIYSTTTYEYDADGKLMREMRSTNHVHPKTIETIYEYNQLNQLVTKTFKTTNYDTSGIIINESGYSIALEYENNLLVKEFDYWGGFDTYEYKEGKVVTKIDYTASGQKYWITRYKYRGEFKIEEKRETATGNLLYLRTFNYDYWNKLTSIIEDGNVIEENFYEGNKLIEKWKFDNDLADYPCRGNYIYKYEF